MLRSRFHARTIPNLRLLIRRMRGGSARHCHPQIESLEDRWLLNGTIVYRDNDFFDANWTAAELSDTTPGPSDSCPSGWGGNVAACFRVEQAAEGGNLFRRVTHAFNLGAVIVGHFQLAAVYNPAREGPIDSVSYEFDVRLLSPQPGPVASYDIVLLQGSSYYRYVQDDATSAAWTHIAHSGLTAAQFNRIAGTGPDRPNFSSCGSPIIFGYLSSNNSDRLERLTSVSGIDNWSVTVRGGTGITFDDIDTSANAVVSLHDRYRSQGVLFGGPTMPAAVVRHGFSGNAAASLPNGVAIPFGSNVVTMTFIVPGTNQLGVTDYVSVKMGDISGEADTIELRAFDVFGNLLGYSRTTEPAPYNLGVVTTMYSAVAGIHRVELWDLDPSGASFDDVEFCTPTAAAALPDVAVPAGFRADLLTRGGGLNQPTNLTVGPNGALYVSNSNSFYTDGATLSRPTGTVVRIDAAGNQGLWGSTYCHPGVDASCTLLGGPLGLAFDPAGQVFVAAEDINDAIGPQISDLVFRVPLGGGTAQRFSNLAAGNLDEPLTLAFGPGGAYGTDLFVTARASGAAFQPYQIFRLNAAGGLALFSTLQGVAGLGFSRGGGFGTSLYVSALAPTAFDPGASPGIYRILPDGTASLVVSLSGGAAPGGGDIAFSVPSSPFGDFLYYLAVDGTIRRVSPTGTVELFATVGNSNGLAFSPDGQTLYVSRYGTRDVFKITASNRPPTDLALSPASVAENSAPGTVVGALSTTDPDAGDTHTYLLLNSAGGRFRLVGNQLRVDNGALLDFEASPSHTVRIRTTDAGGLAFEKDFLITLTNVNEMPTVVITGAPASSAEGTALSLGSVVTDPDAGDSFSYAWSVTKNGVPYASGTAATFGFSPNDNGAYVVTVTVTDRGGLVGTDSRTIAVTNVNPMPTITGVPAGGAEGTTVSLGSMVSDPGTADSFTYAWSVTRNGSAFASGTGTGFTFTPDDNGTYVVTLTVTDDEGGSGTDTRTIVVSNVAPADVRLNLSAATINEGQSTTLSGSFTDPGTLDTHSVVINWGDGSPSTTLDLAAGVLNFAASHQYLDNRPGNAPYTIRVTVTDKDGASAGSLPSGALAWYAGEGNALSSVGTNHGSLVGGVTFAPGMVGQAFRFDGSGQHLVSSGPLGIAGNAAVTIEHWVNLANTSDSGNAMFLGEQRLTGAAFSVNYNYRGPGVVSAEFAGLQGVWSAGAPLVPGQWYHIAIVKTPGPISTSTTIYVNGVAQPLTAAGSMLTPNIVDAPAYLGRFGTWDDASGYFTGLVDEATIYNRALSAAEIQAIVDAGSAGKSSAATITVVVTNVAPTASLSGAPASSPEGTALSLSGSATDPSPVDTAAGFTFAWSVTRNGSAVASGSGSSFSFTPSDNGTYQVTLSATDKDGGTGTTSATILVTNVAPTATITGAPASGSEGTALTLGSTVTDPSTLDTAAGFSYAWSVTRNGSAYTSGTGAGLAFTPDDNGTYVVTLTVTDDDGGSGTDSKTILVSNLAPTTRVTGPSSAVPGQSRTFLLGASDPSPVDQATGFTYRINWGDGTPVQTVGPNAGNGVRAAVEHVFTSVRTYTVQVTATDKDGGTSLTATYTITVTAVALQADPCDASKTALIVGGTSGPDSIHFHPGPGGVVVQLNGQRLGTFAPTGRLIAYGQAGNDDIEVAGGIRLAAWLYGDDGNDRLKGGAGDDVLLGGRGDDLLVGAQGRDLLIGGLGADRLVGNNGEDILIAGATAFDDNPEGLCRILDEWTSARSYADRVANLRGTGTGPRFNGAMFLTADGPLATVFDDGARDLLVGNAGRDWFFANLEGGGTRDYIVGLDCREFADDLEFVRQ